MNKVAELNIEFTPEERNLFSNGYINTINYKRRAWNILKQEEIKIKEKKYLLSHIQKYKKEIEKEIIKTSEELLKILNKNVIPSSHSSESKVFFLKMKGDFTRYILEVDSNNRKTLIRDAIDAYEEALSISYTELDVNNIIRLSLVINLSDFYYNIADSKTKACLLCKNSYDDSIAEFVPSKDSSDHQNVIILLNIIKNNLIEWCSQK
eukprot:gene8398-223_t